MLFFPLINVKMPTIVGILTYMSRKNFMLSGVEHEKSFITSGLGFRSEFQLLVTMDTGYFIQLIYLICQCRLISPYKASSYKGRVPIGMY